MYRDNDRFLSPGYLIDAFRSLPVDEWKNSQVLSRSAYRGIEAHVYRGKDLTRLHNTGPSTLKIPTAEELTNFLPKCYHPSGLPDCKHNKYSSEESGLPDDNHSEKPHRLVRCWQRHACTSCKQRSDESCDSYVSRICSYGYNYPSFSAVWEIGNKLTGYHLINFMRKATRLTFDDSGAKVECGETVLTVRSNWGHEAWYLTRLLADLATHKKCFEQLQALTLMGHQQTNVRFAEWISTIRGLRELRFPEHIIHGRADDQYQYMSTIITNNAKTLRKLENVDTIRILNTSDPVTRSCVRLPHAVYNFITEIKAEKAYTSEGLRILPVMRTSFVINRQHFASSIHLCLHNVWSPDLNQLIGNSILRNRIDVLNFNYCMSDLESWKEAKMLMEKAHEFFRKARELNAKIEYVADVSAWSFAGRLEIGHIEAQCHEISRLITDALTFDENRRVPGKTHVHVNFGLDESLVMTTPVPVPMVDAATKQIIARMSEVFPWFSEGKIGSEGHIVRISYAVNGRQPHSSTPETISPPHFDATPSTGHDSDNDPSVSQL